MRVNEWNNEPKCPPLQSTNFFPQNQANKKIRDDRPTSNINLAGKTKNRVQK